MKFNILNNGRVEFVAVVSSTNLSIFLTIDGDKDMIQDSHPILDKSYDRLFLGKKQPNSVLIKERNSYNYVIVTSNVIRQFQLIWDEIEVFHSNIIRF